MIGFEVRPLGDTAVLARFYGGVSGENVRRVWALARAAREACGPAALDVVPAYDTVLVRFDPLETELAGILACMRGAAERVSAFGAADLGRPAHEPPHASWEVGVCFGGEHGPDLADAAAQLGRTAASLVEALCSTRFQVAFLGFLAGFPYLVGLPQELALARLPTPRAHVPAGSVAIAGDQCGIYPRATPGGWRLLGRTSARLFDLGRTPAALFAPGDDVRFTVSRTLEDAAARAAPRTR